MYIFACVRLDFLFFLNLLGRCKTLKKTVLYDIINIQLKKESSLCTVCL